VRPGSRLDLSEETAGDVSVDGPTELTRVAHLCEVVLPQSKVQVNLVVGEDLVELLAPEVRHLVDGHFDQLEDLLVAEGELVFLVVV